jgi:hypothetical protein
MSLNRATQPGPVSPGGGEQAQRHKPAARLAGPHLSPDAAPRATLTLGARMGFPAVSFVGTGLALALAFESSTALHLRDSWLSRASHQSPGKVFAM